MTKTRNDVNRGGIRASGPVLGYALNAKEPLLPIACVPGSRSNCL